MTILPNLSKKKIQQGSGGAEIEANESSAGTSHIPSHQLPSHIQQNNDSNNLNGIYLASPSPPPHWASSSSNPLPREERAPHSSPSHYEETHESGSSLTKRRYRASPLRSVRPKLRDREHRGSASPPYASTSDVWGVANISHQHNLSHSHTLAIPASTLQPLLGSRSPQAGPSHSPNKNDDDPAGYNSGDEYQSFGNWSLTKEQWEEKERWFEKKMKKKNLIIKKMKEDGACLFRSIADQIFGDEDMNEVVRHQCMDYIERNEDAFAPFVSEHFRTYVERKRRNDCFGNHIEIAAMSEMYNRVIELYCYGTDPINTFNVGLETDNAPLRLSYHRGTHYNSVVNPYQATIGVGLGLPGLQPGIAEKNLMVEAKLQSENFHLEKAMLEDKIRATDFDATSEAIEEQVSQESYIDWLRDQQKNSSKSTETCSARGQISPHHPSTADENVTKCSSPRAQNMTLEQLNRNSPLRVAVMNSPRVSSNSPRSSPRSSHSTNSPRRNSPRSSPKPVPSELCDLAVPGSSKDPSPSSSKSQIEYDGFVVNERASFLNHLPPDAFGLNDYSREEADILAQVLAASQQEYLDTLKSKMEEEDNCTISPTS